MHNITYSTYEVVSNISFPTTIPAIPLPHTWAVISLYLLERSFHFFSVAAPKLEITSYSGKQSWVLGDDVMLTCQAKGNPTPKVRWLKQREEDGLFVPFQSTVDHNGTHLVIKDLKEEDFAVYRCEAVNKMGQMSYDFNVGKFIALWKLRKRTINYVNDSVANGDENGMIFSLITNAPKNPSLP